MRWMMQVKMTTKNDPVTASDIGRLIFCTIAFITLTVILWRFRCLQGDTYAKLDADGSSGVGSVQS